MSLDYIHVDVFSARPLAGNGLIVFPDSTGLGADDMLRITQEMRQFESIFLIDEGDAVAARIFTVEEELPFAGHPLLGAAASLLFDRPADEAALIRFRLGKRIVEVTCRRDGTIIHAEMDQGVPVFGDPAREELADQIYAGHGIAPAHRDDRYPLVMVSTGLPYAILPVTAEGLASAAICAPDFAALLDRVGAQFAYVLDTDAREGRTWDNVGKVEDIATGSAAGPAAAYLHLYADAPDALHINQGRFVGRPSLIDVRRDMATGHYFVGGDVTLVARGTLLNW